MKLWICSAEKAQMRVSSASLCRAIMVRFKSTKILWGTKSFGFFCRFCWIMCNQGFTNWHCIPSWQNGFSVGGGHFLVFIYHITTPQGFSCATRIELCLLNMHFKLQWGYSLLCLIIISCLKHTRICCHIGRLELSGDGNWTNLKTY